MRYPARPAGYGAFGLHYAVEWPLSLVLDRNTVSDYEMLFRHLFYVLSIQTRLAATWKLRIPPAYRVMTLHLSARHVLFVYIIRLVRHVGQSLVTLTFSFHRFGETTCVCYSAQNHAYMYRPTA